MDSKIKELEALLQLKEIIEWQLEIAQDYGTIKERQTQLAEVNKNIEKITKQKQENEGK